MIEFSISTSSIRTDVERLGHLLELGNFHKLEIGFYDEETLPLIMESALSRGLTYGFHDPLPRLPSDDFPFLTDPDEEKRWRHGARSQEYPLCSRMWDRTPTSSSSRPSWA
jgi:hypothetical protein